MRISGAKKVHYDSGPNMTPLVDVVMVILIFLMLTGSFGAATQFLPSTMPIKSTGKGSLDKDKIPKVPDPELNIAVFPNTDGTWTARTDNGELFVNGTSPKSGRTLVQALRELKGKYEDQSKLQVLIGPRIDTRYEAIIAVYQMAMEAECQKIGFKSAG